MNSFQKVNLIRQPYGLPPSPKGKAYFLSVAAEGLLPERSGFKQARSGAGPGTARAHGLGMNMMTSETLRSLPPEGMLMTSPRK